MDFTSGYVFYEDKKINLTINTMSTDDVIFASEIELINDFYSVKIMKKIDDKLKAVRIQENKLIPNKQFLKTHNGIELVEPTFAFINIKNGYFFYSGSRTVFQKLMSIVFNVDKKNLIFNARIEDIKKLKSVTIYHRYESTLINDFPYIPENLKLSIDETLQGRIDPNTTSIKLNYSNALINKAKFGLFIGFLKDNSSSFSIKAEDDFGDEVSITDIVTKKIKIDSLSNYKDFQYLSLEEILNEVLKKIPLPTQSI